MSELAHDRPSFATEEQSPATAESFSPPSESPFPALIDLLGRTDAEGLSEHALAQEQRIIELRVRYLEQAHTAHLAEDYGACRMFLGWVIDEVSHSYDTAKLEQLIAVRENLYEQLRRKNGHTVIAGIQKELH